MRQFHLRDHYFADLVRDDAGNLTTSGNGWVRITSQAGIDAICASITNGGEVWLNDKGQLCVSGPAPAPGMVFDRQKGWQADVQAQAALLVQAKENKLHAIATVAQDFISTAAGLTGIPAFEQESWARQAREAEAWATDNNAETPLLAGIAAARGVPLDLLRQKALSKSRAYTTLTAAVAGQRQALEDEVAACADVAAVEAVKVQFTLPEAA